MANEITVNAGISLANGGEKVALPQEIFRFTQAAQGHLLRVESVATSEEDLVTTGVTVLGWLALRNLDATNYVQWGPSVGGVMEEIGRLEAGEIAMFRLEPGITLRWKANSAAVKVAIFLLED